jgi:hypothetical protein
MIYTETQLRKYTDIVILIYDDLVNNGFTPEQALEIINISVKMWREHERNRYTE